MALILSGGAALGSWQAGVIWSLAAEHGMDFHSALGTSAGSINATAYRQGDLDRLRDLWRDVPRDAFLSFSPGISPPRLLSIEPVRKVLHEVIDEERCRKSERCWLYIISADLNGSGTNQAEFSPNPDEVWDGPLIEHILGSVAVPFVFAPVRVGENGSERVLVDGHLTSFAFLEPLVRRGVRDFIVVSVVHPGEAKTRSLSPRSFISSLIENLLRAQVDNSFALLRGNSDLPEGLRAFEVNPSKPLDMSVFLFKKDECRAAFDLGVEDATEAVGSWESRRFL